MSRLMLCNLGNASTAGNDTNNNANTNSSMEDDDSYPLPTIYRYVQLFNYFSPKRNSLSSHYIKILFKNPLIIYFVNFCEYRKINKLKFNDKICHIHVNRFLILNSIILFFIFIAFLYRIVLFIKIVLSIDPIQYQSIFKLSIFKFSFSFFIMYSISFNVLIMWFAHSYKTRFTRDELSTRYFGGGLLSATSSQSDRVWIISGKVIGIHGVCISSILERKVIFADLKSIVSRRPPRAGDPHAATTAAAAATATYSRW